MTVAGNFAKIIGYRRDLTEARRECYKPVVEINCLNGLLIESTTCSLQICCRIFWQFSLFNQKLCCCPESIPASGLAGAPAG
jgi:hypothetical protein